MDKRYTLAGEDFFRGMMRPEDQRRQRSAGRALWSAGDGGARDSNIVSLDRYRQERRAQKSANKPTTPAA